MVSAANDRRVDCSRPRRLLALGLGAALACGLGLPSIPAAPLASRTSSSHSDRSADSQPADQPAAPEAPLPGTVPAAEFEAQAALMLGASELIWKHPMVFIDIVRAARRNVPVLALVTDQSDLHVGKALLRHCKLPVESVHFLVVPMDTMWVRDYGPLFARRDGTAVAVDGEYASITGPQDRPADDAVPKLLGAGMRIPVANLPVRVEGGNLLTNGEGLCVATTALVERNINEGRNPADVERLLKQGLSVSELLFVDELVGEDTGHVDMFLTFVAPDCVVVARCDPKVDAENAKILDQIATVLAGLQTSIGPMRVHRIPMPPATDGVWRSYTNVIFANGVLIMPTYSGVDAVLEQQALNLYRKLLPGWKVVGVNADGPASRGGSLHCVSLNMPGFVPVDRLLQQAHKSRPEHPEAHVDGQGSVTLPLSELPATRSSNRPDASAERRFDAASESPSEPEEWRPFGPSEGIGTGQASSRKGT